MIPRVAKKSHSNIINQLPNIEMYLSTFNDKTTTEINDFTLGYYFELYKRHENENTSSFVEERQNLFEYKVNWINSDTVDNVNNDFNSSIEIIQKIIEYHKQNQTWPPYYLDLK